jgi:hypothetical protein
MYLYSLQIKGDSKKQKTKKNMGKIIVFGMILAFAKCASQLKYNIGYSVDLELLLCVSENNSEQENTLHHSHRSCNAIIATS